MTYYVYWNAGNQLQAYNVLNQGFLTELKARVTEEMTLSEFSTTVERLLVYYYAHRAEYEIILTSWPPACKVVEINRLSQEIKSHQRKGRSDPIRVTPNLEKALKVSIYDQVKLNWEIFIKYLWEATEHGKTF